MYSVDAQRVLSRQRSARARLDRLTVAVLAASLGSGLASLLTGWHWLSFGMVVAPLYAIGLDAWLARRESRPGGR